MKNELQFSEAIEKAMADGIAIRRGATFNWTDSSKPIPLRCAPPSACNATGAILWAAGEAEKPKQMKTLCSLLEVDSWWLYRFGMGFNQNHQLMVIDQNDKVISVDEVSKLGIRLAKKYVKRSP